MRLPVICKKGIKRPINGHLEIMFKDDKIDAIGKLVLGSYLNTTRHIAGCQAIRRKIGHILFGFRVCYGEALFVTVSPNRRHSALLLTLSRARMNDTGLKRKDATTVWRKSCCGANKPGFCSSFDVDRDPSGRQATLEIPLPDLLQRQALNAQDPLATIHHYDVVMYVVLAATFGVRMCLRCPHCNIDGTDPNKRTKVMGCSDLLGCNSKLMGGFAGLAVAMIFSNEFQGEGTPHGHGFISLANLFQHSTIPEIAALLQENAKKTDAVDILGRVIDFCNHVQRESHVDEDQHKADLPKLEKGFHNSNDAQFDAANVFLSLKPKSLLTNRTLCSLWKKNSKEEEVFFDAAAFKKRFHAHVQFVFSRVQHHWHALNDKGVRMPLPYCRVRHGKGKSSEWCKQNYPRHVVSKHRQKTRLVCRGMAKELGLKVSGRRNMLGSIAPVRSESWFASTACILAGVTSSNTNIQCPYRMPINAATHDPDCNAAGCMQTDVKHLYRLTQRLMKQISGYFGGYISKKQKVGQYELKKSIGALPLLQLKLETRDLKSPSHQLAHVVNRMFTVLESKGILRTATEEFALSAKYHAQDDLSAECIRTCRSEPFHGSKFLTRVEAVAQGAKKMEIKTLLPDAKYGTPSLDVVSMYGFRPKEKDLWYLSPWEFTRWFRCHKLKAPSAGYTLTTLTKEGLRKYHTHSKEPLLIGEDYILNEAEFRTSPHLFRLPSSTEVFQGAPRVFYEQLRNSWLICKRQSPVVPYPSETVLPCGRYMSKHQRAKLCNVYLRPWTLFDTIADVDVIFAGDFGLPSMYSVGTVRQQWKEYLHNILPHAMRTIRNFIANSWAESHRDEDDDDMHEKSTMTYAMTLEDVQRVLTAERKAPRQEEEEDGKKVGGPGPCKGLDC